MPKKKKFIDKKKAVTFHLVHRSQQDPLITDETAPQHVLVPSNTTAPEGHSRPSSSRAASNDPKKRKEEQHKYGVYFDDDYDYLQHLRAPGDNQLEWQRVDQPPPKEKVKSKLKLPSSVFASEFEESEGLLRRGVQSKGPRPDWDPDIVAALDEDFDFEDPANQLEDDFVAKAMEEPEEAADSDDEWTDDDSNGAQFGEDADDEDEAGDTLGPLRGFDGEETKSRFTEYSMSSSVIRRNEQLTLLDDRFERFYEGYDDMEVGALECEDIEGHVELNDSMLLQYADEFKKAHRSIPYEKNVDAARLAKLQVRESDSEEELIELEVSDDEEKKADCESILTTRSTLYNHPKLISEPRKNRIIIDAKTGLPRDVLGEGRDKLTAKSLAKLETEARKTGPKSLCDESIISTLSVLSIRPKDETPDEKRTRKRLLRQYRAERRIEKKANALAFKKEKVRQDKIKANNRQNCQGKKIL